MSWERRIIGGDELRPYLTNESATDFRSLVQALIEQQQATWPMMREAVAGFVEVEYKRHSVKGSEVLAQYNPMRRVSTLAQVDATTIEQRPCFLCADNLPPEERGIEFGDDFIALCNPFPILPRHLVISSRRHVPQSIENSFATMLDLTRDLGEEYFTLYNGPACGASAPDHLHFQACERKWLPIIREIESWERQVLPGDSEVEAFTLQNYRVNALMAQGARREALIRWFEAALKRLAEVTESPVEPMLNMVTVCDGGRQKLEWTMIVFPRSKHRPSCYYAEGDAKLTVSPGAFDLAGILVVPQADHFARIGSPEVERIYAEVTLDDARFDRWLARLNDGLDEE